MNDQSKFERTVKRLLAMPPKPREEMKIGKPRAKTLKQPKKRKPKSD
jgi:hypothetical protein